MWNIKEFDAFGGEEEILYDDLRKRDPGIIKEVETHNDKIKELKEELTKLDELIYTPEFISECKKLIEKFNEGVEGSKKAPYDNYSLGHLLSFVIDDLAELPASSTYHLFWQKMGGKLLEIRERPEIKSQMNKIYDISKTTVDFCLKLKGKLEELRDSYRAEYSLTVEEIYEKSHT